MNYDEYQWPGLSVSESNGIVYINLRDLALVNFENYYKNSYCGSDFLLEDRNNGGVVNSFEAIITISILDINGILLKNYFIPYINGKFDYSVSYTHNKDEKLTILGNIQVTTGSCGQWMRYYSPASVSVSNTSDIPILSELVLKTYPTLGLSYGPWKYKRANSESTGYFVGGAETFYHTIDELPSYYDSKNNIFDWPSEISYKLFVQYNDNDKWTTVYASVTIDKESFDDFVNVKTFEHNAIVELRGDDIVEWTGKFNENYYTNSKAQFAALRAISLDNNPNIFKNIGTYRIYVNKYNNDIQIGTSNVFTIDVSDIISDTPEEPEEPTPPEEPEEPEEPTPPEEYEYPIPTTYKFNESAYFKHSNGEAFTLNDIPYYGFFHILNGEAYVGKTHLESQTKLTRKNTLIADIFLRQYHFDTCFGNFSNISNKAQIDPFELLNLQGLNDLINQINDNNIRCYRNLIIQNPTVYNFLDNDNHFYGLSTFELETRYKWNTVDQTWNDFLFTFSDSIKTESIELGLPAKNEYVYIQPFNKNKNWSFMSNIKMGTFILNEYEEFLYFCSDGYNTYLLEGDFITKKPLKLISSNTEKDEIFDIYNDYSNNYIFLIKESAIEIYDSTSLLNCGELILIDKLETNTSNLNSIKFGKNIRTALNSSTISFFNKYTNQKYYDLNLSKFGIKNILDLSVRDVDDHIIILYKLNTGFYVCYFDPNNIENTFFNKKIYELLDNNSKIEFSKYDSNIFHIYNTHEYQTRSLTFPEYPNGRLELENLLYHDFGYTWNQTKQSYNHINITWDSGQTTSNYYNSQINSTLIRDNKMYMLLHNHGRLYCIKQPLNHRYLLAAPLDLTKEFVETECSQSSFGLYFNSIITNIVKDILNIYSKTSHTFKFTESNVIYDKLMNLSISIEDLYINGNETVNVLVLRRILTSIIDIQKKLLPNT